MKINIKLYGTERCHKSQYYRRLFEDLNIDYAFLDVEDNPVFAEELRNLYTNRKLNFPTILINSKKLRNPSKMEILKWLDRQK